MPSGPLLRYSDKFYDILDDIGDSISREIIEIEADRTVDNPLGITWVEPSRKDWTFDVTIGGKSQEIKIGTFIRQFFGTKFTPKEIVDFSDKYNRARRGQSIEKTPGFKPTPVIVQPFRYNPRDVRSTFLSLTTETYPHGHEEEVVPYIRGAGLKRDQFGNYYKIIGNSTTMFTSHLDTADRSKSPKVTLYTRQEGGDEILYTNGATILGADDKAGVTVMLYMISHNIPGVYYFFIGEERGGIGSGKVSGAFDSIEHLKGIKKCVSFDRRNCHSIITHQLGMRCCSDDFGNALAKEYNANGLDMGLDNGGVYTDSASFIDQIPECTNISVGYFREHTVTETQNITFLKKLCEASVKVNWEGLPAVRKVGLDEEVLEFYGDLLEDFKSLRLTLDYKFISERGKSFISLLVDITDIDAVTDDISSVYRLFTNFGFDPGVMFDDESILIELAVDNHGKFRFGDYMFSKESYEAPDDEDEDDLGSQYDDDWDSFKYNPLDDEYMREFGDDIDDDTIYSNISDDDTPDEEEEYQVGEMSELAYWIRQMFKSNKIESQVTTSGYDMSIYIFPSMREKLSKLVNYFEVISKIRKDLLSHYYTEVELYENKHSYPIFKFTFDWSEQEPSRYRDAAPF